MINDMPELQAHHLDSWVNILNAGMKELAQARKLHREQQGMAG